MMPVLIELPGGLRLHGYGVMLGLSCVLGAHLAVYLSRRSAISRREAWRFAITVIVIGLVGGRVHDVAINARSAGEFLGALLQLEHSGRTAYGAFLSATLGAVFASRVLGVSFWRFGDAAAPTMALGLGLTRIGCFLAGCDYGVRSPGWGVCFPRGSPAWEDQWQRGDIPFGAASSLPVFPVQFVESAAGFAIFGLCLAVWFRRPRREGAVLLTFFASYGLARAAIEQLRDDAGRGVLLDMSTSTTIGLATALAAAALTWTPALARLRDEAGPVLPPPQGDDDPPAPAASP